MATVFVPTPLRKLTAGQSKVEVSSSDINQLIEDLERDYPGIKVRLTDDNGQVKRFINIFVNDQEIRTLKGMDTSIEPNDEVSIIPAMAGG